MNLKFTVFLHDGQIYVSPTRTSFPPCGPPPIDDSPTLTHAPSATWHRCMWAKRDFFELAFYSSTTFLEGELFRHLRFYRRGTVPLEERRTPGHSSEYRILHATQLERLEEILNGVNLILDREADVSVTLDRRSIFGPASEGYTLWSTDQTEVQNRAFFVRKKFLHLIATASFLIASIACSTGDNNRWYSILLAKGVPGPVVDKLASTMVADLRPNVPHAGVFFSPDQATVEWTKYINILIHAKVPVYIAWGPAAPRDDVPRHFRLLYPEEQINDALSSREGPLGVTDGEYGDPGSAIQDSYAFANEPHATPFDGRGVYDPSDQSPSGLFYWKGRPLLHNERPPYLPRFLPSDTPGSFFSRRAAARENYIATVESQQQKVARLAREDGAHLYLVTSKEDDDVYVWNFDDNAMRWTRSLVPWRDRVAVWRLFRPASKRYESVAGEWDVASFLDYDIPGPSIVEEYGVCADNGDNEVHGDAAWKYRPPHPFFHKQDYQLSPPPPMSTSTPSQLAQQSAVVESREPDGGTDTQSAHLSAADYDREVPNFVNFLELLLWFHTFRWGSSDITTLAPSKRLTLENACKAVGFYPPEHGTHSLVAEPERASKVTAWVSLMLDSQKTPPDDWWLLHPGSQYKLKQTVLSQNYPLRLSAMRNADDGKIWWCLHKHSGPPTPWLIAVEDPTVASAAMQSRRSWDNVGRWMLASGISFHTLVYSGAATSQNDEPPDPRPSLRLTIRPFKHVFTAADFEAYEFSRSYMFRDPRIARAALLAGGILWRLAIEEVAPDLALDGPDSLSIEQGIGFRLRDEKDGRVYMDDQLADYEIANIVGMYFEQPDYHRVRWDHDTFPMWWPLPRYFKESAVDYPVWTPVDENWYQSFRQKYRQGELRPKQGVEWRSTLRNWDKRSRQFTAKSREVMDTFLRRNLYQ